MNSCAKLARYRGVKIKIEHGLAGKGTMCFDLNQFLHLNDGMKSLIQHLGGYVENSYALNEY